jgi:hypothetical protein
MWWLDDDGITRPRHRLVHIVVEVWVDDVETVLLFRSARWPAVHWFVRITLQGVVTVRRTT